ncbi:MAG: TIGR00300 family protein [Spirochaetaceae bacterium 4572_59]|nr:MAG: TIGR00300 family protein [Spirochaetaceae bacterium 4572_59]
MTIITEGQLIDSGLLSSILNLIIEEEMDYRILKMDVGKTKDETTRAKIRIYGKTDEKLQLLLSKLTPLGAYEKGAINGVFEKAPLHKTAPEKFYSTTNHRTEVYDKGQWNKVEQQRMDAVIIRDGSRYICTKIRDIREGDDVLCGSESVHAFPPAAEKKSDDGFAFMTNDVSSERSYDVAVDTIANELKQIKDEGGKCVVVCGPVVVHTGGAPALAALIKAGYIKGFLGGNAVAVHDMESYFYGTSLGVNLETGKPTHGGHNHHMRAINKINGYGSIKNTIEAGELDRGLMYEVLQSGIPYCLAGSIRDDGPLPETVMDMIEAQEQYQQIIKDSDMILMLSTMLHSIGTGNMTPSWVKTVCIDINPAVVTKLADRGTGQAVGIVSDVGLFLIALAERLGLKF